MDLKPGMSIANVNSEFWIYCNKGDQKGQHILPNGKHEHDPSILVYQSNPATKRHKDNYEQCEKILYFKDDKLVSDQKIKELESQAEKRKAELKAKIEIKKDLMNSFIKQNSLQVLEKFKELDDDNFKVYTNSSKQFFYSINYEFVDALSVSKEIATHEQQEIERKDRELFEKNRALQLQAQNEKLRIERDLIEKNNKEREQKEKQLLDKVNKLISENNLVIIYKEGTFLVLKNNAGQFVYIKDGVIRKPIELKEEVSTFNIHQKNQMEHALKLREVRNKNLAYRWVVQAQAVCSGGRTCRITGIREMGRLDDGSARFDISHQTWRGTAGSSGITTIICGFGKQNSVRSTFVNAVCQ